MGSRKDDPVLNVHFVQLIESKPCLWNSTLPEYSKKDEIQKAWQEVANETKDTVRNCRERWRSIRSGFLRSLKLSCTNTGRGKCKYYLSKYLQFLIPFTRSRLKNSSIIIAKRKAAAEGNIPPVARISSMATLNSDETKDSSNSAEVGDVMVSLHDGVVGTFPNAQNATLPLPLPLPLPLDLQTIKQENDVPTSSLGGGNMTKIVPLETTLEQQQSSTNNYLASIRIANNSNNNNNSDCIDNNTNDKNNLGGSTTNSNSISGSIINKKSKKTCNNSTVFEKTITNDDNQNNINNNKRNITQSSLSNDIYSSQPTDIHSFNTVDLTEFAEWLKSKNEYQRHCSMTTFPDADQSFLNSLHPYLREMSGKQNRRFRQKVVALIDAILDNTD